MSPPVRFRTSRTALLPVVVLFLCVLPVTALSPWSLLVLLIPVAALAWVLRAGVDVDDGGVTVRSLVGQRRIGWPEVAGVRVGKAGGLWLVTERGTQVRLPVLRLRDLPRLAAASGGRIRVPEPPAAAPT